MITQEMVEVAAAAIWRKDYPKGGSRYTKFEDTPEHDKELYRNDARSALYAVYPLILEQAARVCDEWHMKKRKENAEYENTGDKETAVICIAQASMAASCSAKIRNLKDKTDE